MHNTLKSKKKNEIMASSALLAGYQQVVESGEIRDDEAQRRVLEKLEDIRSILETPVNERAFSITKLWSKPSKQRAQSLYIWGQVGRGKSMLMDLFFNAMTLPQKRRVHFHAFMQEVHARIHELRQHGARGKSGADPVITLAREIAATTKLFCFDELQATDVADATLLYRLFAELFEQQVVIVSTSNRPPAMLYTGGVQKERFDKFIALLESHMEIAPLDSKTDYRGIKAPSHSKSFHTPLGESAEAFIASWVGDKQPVQGSITVMGRKLPFKLYGEDTGRFSFHDLCEQPVGAADYLAIAQRLKVLILTDIPKLAAEKRNEAKRFVTLIDALYEHKVKLIATCETVPASIYDTGDGSFEFKRTVSRLNEMQSESWLKR
jgi:cell division protein ZapE